MDPTTKNNIQQMPRTNRKLFCPLKVILKVFEFYKNPEGTDYLHEFRNYCKPFYLNT